MTRPRIALVLALVGLAGPPPVARAAGIDFAAHRIVDRSHPFDGHTLDRPTSPTTLQLERPAFGMTEGGFFHSATAPCAPGHGGTVIGLPLKIAGGSGAPMRAIALLPKR